MKELAFKFVFGLRLHMLFRLLFQKNKVTILLFHELPLDNAHRIVSFLNRHYEVITLDQYIGHRLHANPSELPPYSLVITFDDGRKSNMELIDIFQEHKNSPTIYVCSDRNQLDGYPLFNEKDFDRANLVYDLQAHTISHPDLKKTSDLNAETEIGRSKIDLEAKLGKQITSFAYPYGRYTPRDTELARKAGYSNAVTVDFGFNSKQTDLFRLKRICISDTPTLYETAVKTCGFWGIIRKGFKSASN
ncbi:polysaccharide deacetylase family protein [Flagellimonas sp. 2504JD4-2]